MRTKRETLRALISDQLLEIAYAQSESIHAMAKTLGVSYPTATKWVRESRIGERQQGYTPPALKFTGLQCRLAREYLGYTRDDMSEACNVGKTAIRQFELGKSTSRLTTSNKIESFFRVRNIVFQEDKITFCDTSKNSKNVDGDKHE